MLSGRQEVVSVFLDEGSDGITERKKKVACVGRFGVLASWVEECMREMAMYGSIGEDKGSDRSWRCMFKNMYSVVSFGSSTSRYCAHAPLTNH